MKRLLREPLVQFLLLGSLLFLANGAFRSVPPAAGSSEQVIRIGTNQVLHLVNVFEQIWHRLPTEAELQGLVEAQITEELYYREAVRLGLDRDDPIVRRRLRQRLEVLTEESAGLNEPSPEELQAYLTTHRADFRLEPRVTFDQIFLDPELRGPALTEDAHRLLSILAKTSESDLESTELGDPILLARRFADRALSDVVRLLGPEFGTALSNLPLGCWSGPVESKYGMHLVRVASRSSERDPELAEVRDAVLREWAAEERRKAGEAFLQSLRNRTTVMVDVSATNLAGLIPPGPADAASPP